MGIGTVSITEISQPEALLSFIRENGIGIEMTDKEADMLLGYMEGHDYAVGFAGDRLYRGDLDEIPGEIVWEEYSVDDLIDSVCEWNYELILDMTAVFQEPANMADYTDRQSEYGKLKQQEAILDRLFDQTKYRYDIDKIAEELANQFIQNLNKNGMEQSVNNLVSEIKQPSMSGRSR
jgi:hypothetical protein